MVPEATDARPGRANEGGDSPAEWDDPSTLPIEQVQDLFVNLAKALRANQLYDENNPVYQRFAASLKQAFERLWTSVDVLQLLVEEDRFTWTGETVYQSDNRADSLAFLFHKDGIRGISFLQGIEEQEIDRLLSVLQRARNARLDGDDLLTILWDEDLQYFKHSYVDLLAEGLTLPEGNTLEIDSFAAILEGELQFMQEEGGEEAEGEDDGSPASAAAPSSTVKKEDFNPTLYALDPSEMEQLRGEVNREMTRDLRQDVLHALFDRLEEPERPERQLEILGIIRALLPNLLSHGALRVSSQILEELVALRRTPDILDNASLGLASEILDDVSAPEAVHELVRAFEDRSIRATASELAVFLKFLRPAALGPLVRAAEVIEDKELQPILREAVRGIAEGNHPALFRLLDSPDTIVASGAIRLTGAMGLTGAGPTLSRLLRHHSPAVRLASVESSVTLRTSTVTKALEEVLSDTNREVRIAAARGLAELAYAPSAERFREIIGGKAIRQADLTEKIAFFESYGDLGDEKGLALLNGLLNGRSFLGRRRESPEIRACAALALGRLNDPRARTALESALDEEDAVIRSAVKRALRRESE